MTLPATEDEWRAVLTPEQFRVLRKSATEKPFTGEYYANYEKGLYLCVACGAPLYKSNTKFDSKCGWPAFYECVPGAVTRSSDTSGGMERIAINCAKCGGHLGHVFKGENYGTPTDERHCVNSVCLKFTKEE